MPKVSNYTQTRIELLYKQDLHPAEILKLLKGEGLLVSFSNVMRIIKKLLLAGSVANLPRSGRPTKLSVEENTYSFLANASLYPLHDVVIQATSTPQAKTTVDS